MKKYRYVPKEYEEDFYSPATEILSSISVDEGIQHTCITVFNRGGNAGFLLVNTKDAQWFIDRLTAISDMIKVEQ